MMWLIGLCSAGGTAMVGDAPLYAGEKNALRLYYVVGPEGMTAGDKIRVTDPVFHGVRWNRWGNLLTDETACTPAKEQDFSDPEASRSLISATTDSSASILMNRSVASDGGSTLINASTVVEVMEGNLLPGEVIEILYGDNRNNPDCGQQLPPHAWRRVPLNVEEDLGGASFVPLAEAPTFDILPLPELSRVQAEVPSQVLVGQPFTLKVAPMDRRGNPLRTWIGTVSLPEEYGGETWTFGEQDQGFHDFRIMIDSPGVHRIIVHTDGVDGRSNPVEVLETEPPSWTFWGDLHVHQGHHFQQDGEVVDENIYYARDIMGLDFVTEAMKADPDCLESVSLWEHLQEQCRSQTEDGAFIYMQGFEWMGTRFNNTTGHHNFYMDTCEIDRPAYQSAEVPEGIGPFGSGQGPYEWAAQKEIEGIRTVIVPHATRYTTYAWTGDSINNRYRRSAEVYSGWGVSMEPFSKAGSIVDGLNSGNRLGFFASSDSHNGWASNPNPEYDNTPGVAALLATRLGRSELMDALQQRHSYGTTGARILLSTTIQDSGKEVEIGTQYMAAGPVVHWEVHGTGAVRMVRVVGLPIVEDAEAIDLCVERPEAEDASGSCTIPWSGQETAVWVQVTQVDGHQAWASPWWLSADCAGEGVTDPLALCAPVDSPPEDSAEESTPLPPDPRCGCKEGSGALILLGLWSWKKRRDGRKNNVTLNRVTSQLTGTR